MYLDLEDRVGIHKLEVTINNNNETVAETNMKGRVSILFG